jgi:hypothetical protein
MKTPFTDPDPMAETIAQILEAQQTAPTPVVRLDENAADFRAVNEAVRAAIKQSHPADMIQFAITCLIVARGHAGTTEQQRPKINDLIGRLDRFSDTY